MKRRPFYLPGSYLVLELTNACNLRCIHCARAEQTHAHYREVGHFPREAIKGVLDDLASHGIRFDNLLLFWLGEPLAHPEFTELYNELLARVGRDGPFRHIELHTNGTLLSRRVAAEILNRTEVPQRWHVTIDAATTGTYRRIKGRDRLSLVEENLERLVAFRARGGFPWPRFVVQFIVSDRNESEAVPFIARWQRVFEEVGIEAVPVAFHVPDDWTRDYIFFRALDCPTPQSQAEQDAVYARVIRRLGLKTLQAPIPDLPPATEIASGAQQEAAPCSGFWKSPVIGWNGMVTTCTRDNTGEHSLGNVLETPFSELWFGEGLIRKWREEVRRGSYESLPLCRTCFIPQCVNYTGITVEELELVEGRG